MQLTTAKTIIPLFQQTNGAVCDLTAKGADIRFIAHVSNSSTGVEDWLIRAADETLTGAVLLPLATPKLLTMTVAGSGAKLRLGEVLNCYDGSSDFLGSIVVNAIDGEDISFSFSGDNDFSFDTSEIASIDILSDPFLLDLDPREFISANIKFLVVQAEAACELSIIPLSRTGVEQ